MLDPKSNRHDYGEMLMPPEGYYLTKAIALTYSLDLDTLLSIPVALHFSQTTDISIKENLVQVLDSIKKSKATVRVICQRGQIAIPKGKHQLYSLMEEMVIEYDTESNYSFHPKIWVLKYSNKENESVYRLIVLSRNLTYDRSWDVVFKMEGELKNGLQSKNKPLINFLDEVTKHTILKGYDTFFEELSRVKFNIDFPFEDYTFLPFHPNIKSGIKNVIGENYYDKGLIISPFLSNDFISEFSNSIVNDKKQDKIIFSSESEIRTKLSAELQNSIKGYYLKDDIISYDQKFSEENSVSQEELPKQFDNNIHAKVYSFKAGWDAHLFLGSNNATNRGFRKNIEFLIQLKGKNSQIGPETIEKELLGEKESLFDLFIPNDNTQEVDNLLQIAEDALEVVKRAILNVEIEGNVFLNDDGNYGVELNLGKLDYPTNKEISVECFLLNNPDQIKEVDSVLKFHNIKTADLTVFIGFVVTNKKHKLQKSFIIKVLLNGLPDNRDQAIFNSIISNPSNFFKYLRFLLSESFWDALPDNGETNLNQFFGAGSGQIFKPEEPIFESLLKAYSRNKEKLMEIDELITTMSKDDDNSSKIIPDDFMKIWNVFKQAIR